MHAYMKIKCENVENNADWSRGEWIVMYSLVLYYLDDIKIK